MDMRWALVAFVVLFSFGCTNSQTLPPGGNSTINTTITPLHSSSEVTEYLQKHLVVYYGLWNFEIPQPSFSEGEWTSDVKVTMDNGDFLVLRSVVDDKNLTLADMWQMVFLNKEPAGIQNIAGKLSCSENGKLKVIEFANPYCPNCVLSERASELVRRKFNNSIEYEYRVMLPTTNNMIEGYGYANVSLASKYYICMQKQNLLDPFRKCAMEKYSKQEGIPLSKLDLDSCAVYSNVNQTELPICVAGADKLLDLDSKLGQTYLGSYAQLPTFAVDCKLKMSNANLVRYAICFNYPQTEGC
jgi:hypothetical protein